MRQLVSHVWAAFTRLLYKRTILVLTLLFCSGIAAALWNMSRLSIEVVRAQALQNAALYAQAIQEARTLYSSDAIERIKSGHGIILTDDYRDKEGAIPVPATFLIELGHRISKENPGMSVRLYSDFPFPSRQSEGGARDDFERKALRHLRQKPKQPFVRVENFQGRLALRYAQADIMKPSCIGCHNQTSSNSPKKDWKVGDVRGVLEITTPLDRFLGRSQAAVQGTFAMLTGFSVLGLIGIALVIGRLRQTSKELELRVIERTVQLQTMNEELAKEQEKSERLLRNILPEPIAQQLKERTSHIADGFADVTILFADIVGFTELSEQLSPAQLVSILNEIFSTFDRLSEQYGLEKIKTIGDAYMVVGGIPTPRSDHADAIAQMALDMRKEVARFNLKHSISINIRIGINTGPVVAGVIGTKKFIYDLWGDAVNTASRMESHGLAGCIQVTQATYELLQNQYLFQERGRIQIKGKGEMTTYLLIGKKEVTLLV